jgi:hypothetical protein
MRDESSHCRDDIDEFKGGRTPLCVERAMDDGRDGYRSCSNGSIELKEVLDGTVSDKVGNGANVEISKEADMVN